MAILDNIYIGNLLEEKECYIDKNRYQYYEVIDTPLFFYLEENNEKYAVLLSGVMMGEKLDLKNNYFLNNIKSLKDIRIYQKSFDLNTIISHYKLNVGSFYTKSMYSNSFILVRDAQRIIDIIDNRENKDSKVISIAKYQNVIKHY